MLLSSETKVTLEDSKFSNVTRVALKFTRVTSEESNSSTVTKVTLKGSKPVFPFFSFLPLCSCLQNQEYH